MSGVQFPLQPQLRLTTTYFAVVSASSITSVKDRPERMLPSLQTDFPVPEEQLGWRSLSGVFARVAAEEVAHLLLESLGKVATKRLNCRLQAALQAGSIRD